MDVTFVRECYLNKIGSTCLFVVESNNTPCYENYDVHQDSF